MSIGQIDLRFMISWKVRAPLAVSRSVYGFILILLAGISPFQVRAIAQTVSTPSQQPSNVVGPTWISLTKSQQVALSPLSKTWDSLSEGQKRKWLAIAKTYSELGMPDQEKMHSRMVEWAALSPKDRELARLNFAQSKAVDKTNRAADWEAYQALSPEERQKFAADTKVKPVGAAVAAKPVAPEKLASVPVTRHTPEQERASVTSQHPLNRSTLLPQLSTNTTDANAVPAVKP